MSTFSLFYLFVSIVLFTESRADQTESVFIKTVANCESFLGSRSASHLIIPTTFESPKGPGGLKTGGLVPKRGDAFVAFSPDGKTALIRHAVFPSGEQLSIVDVRTGMLKSGATWVGKSPFVSSLWSAAIDDNGERLVALGNNQRADNTDQLITWDISSGHENSMDLRPPDTAEYPVYEGFRNESGVRTPVSVDHPYFMHYKLLCFDENTKRCQYLAEITNYKTGKQIKIQDVFFADQFLKEIDVFNSKFGFMALPGRDGYRVNITKFEEIEHQMGIENASALHVDGEFHHALVHKRIVDKLLVGKETPVVVTTTRAGIYIWNAKTGSSIGEILTSKREFALVENIGAVAYLTDDNQFGLYSYLTHQVIFTAPYKPTHGLASTIESWQQGIAYYRNHDGRVLHIRLRDDNGLAYDVLDSLINVEVSQEVSYLSVLSTEKDHYLIVTSVKDYDPRRTTCSLNVKFYSLRHKNLVHEQNFEMDQYYALKMDPDRTRIFYTPTKREIGYINLKRLLEELNL